MNLDNYFPILLFMLVGIVIGVMPMIMGRFLGPHLPDEQKLSVYECGFEVFEDSRMRFDVRYYLIAILFILFDLETVLLLPWAVSAGHSGLGVFVLVVLFIIELLVGLIYLWKKGALDWD